MAKKRKIETDSVFFLHVLLYFILGTIWIKSGDRPVIPAGFLLGLMFAQHEHFMIDRRIEYVVLLIASMIGLAGYGIFISFHL